MIKLLSEVVKDMLSFLILLFYSTVGFAFIFLVLDKNDPQLIDYLKPSYVLNLGAFETDDLTNLQWICLFLATMINMLIMLNLLISIMGSTFGRVQEESEIADRKEQLSMIIELETLMYKKRNLESLFYFHVCQDEATEDLEVNMGTRIIKISKTQKTFQEENRQEIKGLKTSVTEIKATLKQILSKLEGKDKEEGENKEEENSEGGSENNEEYGMEGDQEQAEEAY